MTMIPKSLFQNPQTKSWHSIRHTQLETMDSLILPMTSPDVQVPPRLVIVLALSVESARPTSRSNYTQ